MAGIFGQVLSAFKSILSSSFWFGAFLPVAVFAAVNLLLAAQFSSAAKEILNHVARPVYVGSFTIQVSTATI